MKNIILYFIFLIALNLNAQVFTIPSGTNLFITANTTFNALNLTIVPSSDFTLSNLSLSKNTTVTNSTSETYVARVYQFSPTTNAFSGTIQVNYEDAELRGLTESTLQVNYHDGTAWYPITSTTNETTSNYVVSNSISSKTINEISLAGSVAPLPVELTNFKVNIFNGDVVLTWETITETNNYGFDIEKKIIQGNDNSINNWTKIGFVKGNGTSNIIRNYKFTDNGIRKGRYSYRLKQIDRDGKFEYNKEEEITLGLNPNKIVIDGNYPNPFNNETVISFQLPVSGVANIKLYNLTGKEVVEILNKPMEAGFHEVRFNFGSLPSGVYYYKIIQNDKSEFKKLLFLK